MSGTWKWSFGEPPEKTPRPLRSSAAQQAASVAQPEEELPPAACYTREGGLRSVVVGGGSATALTPQEELYDRINHREKFVQIGQNPFHQTNYVQDIEIQDRFLRGIVTAEKSNLNTSI